MRENVTVSYRGTGYELGRGRGFYGIWRAGAAGSGTPGAQPPEPALEWWPETPSGWASAWSRFTSIQNPATIVSVARPAVWTASSATRGRLAAALLAAGVVLGLVGLFPNYYGGSSIASESVELVPHVIYLLAWVASAVLILLGGTRLRVGALLGAGVSAVTFGFFFSDAATAISSGSHQVGAGLLLGFIGWLVCAGGSAVGLTAGAASGSTAAGPTVTPAVQAGAPGSGTWGAGSGGPGYGAAAPGYGTAGYGSGNPGQAGVIGGNRAAGGRAARRGLGGGAVMTTVLAVLAAVGAAVTFAPSWDSYGLRTATGISQTMTMGNAFSNPGAVIFGDVAVMVILVAVVVVAVLLRSARLGAALLIGAVIPLIGQAISAVVQISASTSPAMFGLSRAQAAQVGLKINAGLTAWFWAFCVFTLVLAILAIRMGLTRTGSRPGTAASVQADGAAPGSAQPRTGVPGASEPVGVGAGSAGPASQQLTDGPWSASPAPAPSASAGSTAESATGIRLPDSGAGADRPTLTGGDPAAPPES